jgi:hypothetical protein
MGYILINSTFYLQGQIFMSSAGTVIMTLQFSEGKCRNSCLRTGNKYNPPICTVYNPSSSQYHLVSIHLDAKLQNIKLQNK